MILGHGIDLVDIARIGKLVANAAFVRKIYTPAEQSYCMDRADSAACYAARFAAKEAVAKALGTGIGAHASWLDIEVRNDRVGAPSVTLSGAAARRAHEMGVERWHVSFTHDGGMAMASVLAEKAG